MTPARASAVAFAAALLSAAIPAALVVDRTPPGAPTAAAALRASRARHDDDARRLAALLRSPDDLRPLAPALPLRSAQLLGPRGTVLASYDAPPSPAPACPPRVVERPAATEGARLVATFDDDCAALAALDAPARERAPLARAAFAALACAAVAAWGARRLSLARARGVAAFAVAARRVGDGDLAVRVRARGGELDGLAAAFNLMVEALGLTRERVDYLQRLVGWQDLARRLAHEIKNPLTPIQLAVQEAARKYEGDDARFKRTLEAAREIVEEEVATLRRLVTAFSDFARLPDVKPAPGDLAEFVRDAASSRAFLDEAAGDAAKAVRVEFAAGDAAIPVMIDRMMLRRAFENLVRNAAQALGARGGTIWVRSERRRVAVTGPDGVDEVEQAWLVVEDDGPGVPKASQTRVFDPYFTTKSEGTGLGLAIVRKVAIDHAGDVGLEDRTGGGARFVIALPLRDPSRRPRLSFVTFTRGG